MKKNEGSHINVKVNTNHKAGNLAKTVTVTTNDPTQSTVILTVKGYVKKAESVQESPQPGTKPQPMIPRH